MLLTLHPIGPAQRPNNCSFVNVTSSHVCIDCWEEFDGGSTPYYTLGMLLGEQFIAMENQSSLIFDLYTLAPGTVYTFQICASNEHFWQDEDCTLPFEVRTLASNCEYKANRDTMYIFKWKAPSWSSTGGTLSNGEYKV